MNGRGRGSDGQDDVDAAFAEIVADLERDGFGSELGADTGTAKPADPEPPTEPGRGAIANPGRTVEPERPIERGQPPRGGGIWRGMESEWDWAAAVPDSDSEHYVPPDPPPLPRPRAGTIAALVLLVTGVLLLVAPALFGLPARVGTPIALVALATGIGLLVLRMRSGPPPDTGWDDGAQV